MMKKKRIFLTLLPFFLIVGLLGCGDTTDFEPIGGAGALAANNGTAPNNNPAPGGADFRQVPGQVAVPQGVNL